MKNLPASLLLLASCTSPTVRPEPKPDTGNVDSGQDTDIDIDSTEPVDANLSLLQDDIALGTYERDGTEAVYRVDFNATLSEDGASLSGTNHYFFSSYGSTVCDNEIAVFGNAFTGTCVNCEWAFEISSELVSGNPDCGMYAPLSLVPDATYPALFLGLSSAYPSYNYYLYDVFMVGYSADADPVSPTWIPWSAWPNSTFTRYGNDFTWTFDYEIPAYAYTITYDFYNYCGNFLTSYASQAYEGEEAESTLPCDGSGVDIWSFDAIAGDTLSITADTASKERASDLAFVYDDPEGCTLGAADDNFDCTYAPSAYQCPSASFVAESTGTYRVLVFTWGQCVGRSADYNLKVGVER